MEQGPIGKRLMEYNHILLEQDSIYREAAKASGLPDIAFWILYTLRADGENSEAITQTQICEILCQPKQTVNTSLKKLAEQGYLELRTGADRRRKYVYLTDPGRELARRTADRVIAAEELAFQKMTERKRQTLFDLMREYNDTLRISLKESGEGSV